MADKTKVLITTLVALVVVLGAVVLYTFVIEPTISGNAVERQQEGIEFAIVNIAQQAATCQPVPLNLGQTEDGQEQVINLVAIECFPDRFPELSQQTEGTQQVPQEETSGEEVIEE